VRRKHAFLRDQLNDIGERLQQAMRTDARRPHAHLHVRDHFALDPLQVSKRRQQDERNDRGLNERDDDEFH
jgi:hypothetical protein